MIWVKRHGKVLAACDKNLVGKTLQEGKLEVEVRESFYKGELISEEKLSELLDMTDNINLIGENCIRVAKGKSLIADVRKIQGVPVALIFKI